MTRRILNVMTSAQACYSIHNVVFPANFVREKSSSPFFSGSGQSIRIGLTESDPHPAPVKTGSAPKLKSPRNIVHQRIANYKCPDNIIPKCAKTGQLTTFFPKIFFTNLLEVHMVGRTRVLKFFLCTYVVWKDNKAVANFISTSFTKFLTLMNFLIKFIK